MFTPSLSSQLMCFLLYATDVQLATVKEMLDLELSLRARGRIAAPQPHHRPDWPEDLSLAGLHSSHS